MSPARAGLFTIAAVHAILQLLPSGDPWLKVVSALVFPTSLYFALRMKS